MFGFKKKDGKNDGVPVNRRRNPSERATSNSAVPVEKGPPSKRSQQIRGASKAVLRILTAAALTAAVVLLGIAAYRHATSADYFRLKAVDVSGNDRLSDEDILATAGLSLGANIFSVDVSTVRGMLLDNPWIEQAEAVRRLPGELTIRVVERKPRALVNLDVLYLVDDAGKVFKRWVRGDPVPSPVITGISREEYLQSPNAEEAVLCDAIDLADRYARQGLERIAPLQEIFREPDGGFSLTVGEDSVYVKFGRGPFKDKLNRLGALLRRLSSENKRAAQVFFDNVIRPDRITVKLKPTYSEPESGAVSITTDDAKKIVSKI